MASTVDIILKATDQASGEIKSASGALETLGSVAGGIVTVGLAAAAAGFAALGAATAFSISQALGNEKIQASLTQAIKASGNAAGLTAEAANALAQQFVGLAGGTDDAILAIETIGIRAGTISANEMPAFIQSTLDLGAVMGDTSSAATLLARAQEDPIAALGKLQRAGIIFTDALKDQIKELVKNNDVAGATALIMGRVAEATGGAAAANAQTLAGQWEILKGQLGEAAEAVGMALLPTLHDLFDSTIKPAIPIIQDFAAALAVVISDIAGGDIGVAFDDLRESILAIGESLGIPKASLLEFNQRLTDVWNFVVQNWPAVQATIQTTAANAVAALQPLIAAVGNVLAAFVTSMPVIMSTFADMAAFVIAQVEMLSPTLIANVSNMLNQLAIFWTNHGAQIMAIVDFAFKVITTTIGVALVLASGIISNAMNIINGNWGAVWGTITSTLTTAMNMILAIVGTNLTEFSAVWSANWNMAKIIITTAWNGIQTAVTSSLNAVTGNIQAAIIDVVNWLRQFVPQFIQVGRNMIDGIAQGVRDAVGGLINSVVGAVTSAITAAQGALQSHSPSLVFAGLGANMMQGMALGINQNARLPAQAVGGAVAGTVNNYYTVNAAYGNQSQGTVAQELRLMSKLNK